MLVWTGFIWLLSLTQANMEASTPTIQHLLSKYLQYAEVMRNYSPYTLLGYKNAWRIFLAENPVEYPDQLNKDIFEQWFFRGRLERNWGPTTFQRRVDVLELKKSTELYGVSVESIL